MKRRTYKDPIKKRKRLRAAIIAVAIIAIAVCAAIACFFIIKREGPAASSSYYLASTSGDAEVYIYDDYEKRLFLTHSDLKRGDEVISKNETYTENGRDYVVVSAGDQTYYVNAKRLVKSLDDIVQETEKYVRTPVTVYKEKDSAEICSYIPKGSHVNISGYDKLLDDGNVNMYKIESDGITGWVYGKYLVDGQKEAEAVNEEIYDIHKERAYGSDLYGGSASNLDWYAYEKPSFEDNTLLDDARVMYLCNKSYANIDEYLALAKKYGINAVCMDIKDKLLCCQFDTAAEISPTSNENYSYSQEYMEQVVQKIKDAGLYLICRIVVFRDTYYAEDHPEECIVSDQSTSVWPSAYSRNVWYYNVELALEVIERFSPNEIQFDYVRFPEEAYRMSTADDTDFRNTYNEDKCQAIQNFLFYACDTIHQKGVYVSADVFAECANKYVSAYGQYFPAISNIVDVISAMPYTDHFGTSEDTWSDPYTTVYDWAKRAAQRQAEIETPALARTWLTCYSVPFWNPVTDCDSDYFSKEAQALYDAGLTGGFLSWNSASGMDTYTAVGSAWGYDYTK